MKKAFIVTLSPKDSPDRRKNLGSKSKRNILPARGLVSDSTVLVASKLSFGPLHV